MKITLAGILILLTAVPMSAQSARRPWEWTLEERLALRANSVAARERVHASRDALKAETNRSSQDEVVDVITGKTHPELFLPHEVFDELMQLAFLSKPRVSDSFRHDMAPIVAEYGLPSDFWERLRTLTAIYIADAHRAYDFPANRKPAAQSTQRDREEFDREFNRNYAVLCRSRVDSLAKARQEFGTERFDRFLYGAIARNMFRTSFSAEDPQILRRSEEGCR
ncbi:MAG: hypothetical protein ACTHQM_19975 [Thermoanaerobaculia bacterium]